MFILCSLDAIEKNGSKGFQSPLGPIIAVKKKKKVYLYANECPHMGINLEWEPDQFLDSSKQLIQCAMHGAQFLIKTGTCIYGPCKGQSLRSIPYEINEHNEICLQVTTNTKIKPQQPVE